MRLRRTVLSAVTAAGLGVFGWAAMAQTPSWETVGPIFSAYCTGCHGGTAPRAGLDLRTYATALAGSNGGPVMIAGDPDASLLMQRIRGQILPQMPRGRAPLSEAEIAWIAAWITAGMPE